MKRPSLRLLASAVAVLAVAATGVSVASSRDDPVDVGKPEAKTVAVTTRDLVEREELDGSLGYGERTDVSLTGAGMVTALPDEGDVVDRGAVIAEVDGRPVRLLFGSRPLWRVLDASVGNGPDVRQVEENLVALGHATSKDLAVDEDWTEATTAAVKRWQKANGGVQSGSVAPSDVVILPGAVRIAERKSAVGAPSGAGPALAVTATEKIVTVALDASRRELLPVGMTVEVQLPGGTTVGGTVRSVSSVVTPPVDEAKGGRATVEVIIALAGDVRGAFDSSPVDVLVTAEKAEGVVAVPVDALLALAEGGYAVERVRSRRTELVGVTIGAFAEGHVQVTGDIVAGDHVVVPR